MSAMSALGVPGPFVAMLGIFVRLPPARDDQMRDVVPGVMNADEKQKQRARCNAEEGLLCVRPRTVPRGGEHAICDCRKQHVKQPVFEDGLVVWCARRHTM